MKAGFFKCIHQSLTRLCPGSRDLSRKATPGTASYLAHESISNGFLQRNTRLVLAFDDFNGKMFDFVKVGE